MKHFMVHKPSPVATKLLPLSDDVSSKGGALRPSNLKQFQVPLNVAKICTLPHLTDKTVRAAFQSPPHKQMDTEESLYSCSFPTCDYKSRWKANVDRHEKGHNNSHHSPFANWDLFCQICQRNYGPLFSFLHHTSSQHPKRLICPLCPFLAKKLAQFKAHMIAHSFTESILDGPFHKFNAKKVGSLKAEGPKFICQKSRKEISKKDTRANKVVQKQCKKNPFLCGNGSKTFTFKGNLVRHQKKSCKSNDATTAQRGLGQHRKTPVAAAAETSNHVSIVAAVVDKKKSGGILVEKSNEGQARAKCSLRTKLRSGLKYHLMVHRGHKPFRSCPVQGCKYRTKWSESLRTHFRLLHRSKPLPGVRLQSKENQGSERQCASPTEGFFESSSGMAFACMLCDFIGDSELSALEHARQHTAVLIPLDQILEEHKL